LPVAFTVMSAFGSSSSRNNSRNEGTAITTRMMTGRMVQRTSIGVLWVVREGVGLARALKRTTTIPNSTRTNSVIALMSQSSKSWNQTMSTMTGVAAGCRPSCQGAGCPVSARAGPAPVSAPMSPLPASTAPTVTARAAKRENTVIFLSAPCSSISANVLNSATVPVGTNFGRNKQRVLPPLAASPGLTSRANGAG
jgi:hypothetical protein